MVTEEQVREALKQVVDPELFVNVVDLGLVYKIDIKDNNEVHVDLGLTTPACPLGPQMVMQATRAIEALEPGLKAQVRLTFDPPWTPDRMSQEAKDKLGFY